MLSDDDRRRIEADAASRVRAEWGRVNPRALGEVVEEIRVRMQDGTWGTLSFTEQLDEIVRLNHANAVFAKDEAAFERTEREAPEIGD